MFSSNLKAELKFLRSLPEFYEDERRDKKPSVVNFSGLVTENSSKHLRYDEFFSSSYKKSFKTMMTSFSLSVGDAYLITVDRDGVEQWVLSVSDGHNYITHRGTIDNLSTLLRMAQAYWNLLRYGSIEDK